VPPIEENEAMPLTIPPPATDEYAEFHHGYMTRMVGEVDAIAVLDRQREHIEAFRQLTPEEAGHRYEPGKWSVREIIGHLADSERVFAYRLLCIARGETKSLPGFSEQAYAEASNADRRTLNDLVDELAAVRASTLALVRSLDESVLANRGVVNEWTLSVRAIAFITAGHLAHHVAVLRERYQLAFGSRPSAFGS
jgi:hypothetical protein